jgi:hypothetical protein
MRGSLSNSAGSCGNAGASTVSPFGPGEAIFQSVEVLERWSVGLELIVRALSATVRRLCVCGSGSGSCESEGRGARGALVAEREALEGAEAA